MLFLDVNVLLYAHKADLPQHAAYARWLEMLVAGTQPFAVSSAVLSSFLRISTNPKLFNPASTLEEALSFTEALRSRPNCRVLKPGRDHWNIFTNLCREVGATGNLIPDAYIAALVIEQGCELGTTDRDFARFPGLKWHHPLDPS